jgi:hypothetical protein
VGRSVTDPGWSVINDSDAANGRVRFLSLNPSGESEWTAHLLFQVMESNYANRLSLEVESILDPRGISLTGVGEAGVVHALGLASLTDSALPLKSHPGFPASEDESESQGVATGGLRLGDGDEDGVVGYGDVLMAGRVSVGLIPEPEDPRPVCFYDIQGDGWINFSDVRAIAAMALHLEPLPSPSMPLVCAIAGSDQVGQTGQRLSKALSAQLLDAYGEPRSGVRLEWEPDPGSGQVSPSAVVTNLSGLTETAWTLGDTRGVQRVRVTADGARSMTFLATTSSVAPPRTLGAFFYDDFESGDLSKRGDSQSRNFRWNPVKVFNSDLIALSGSRSAWVRFLGGDDPNNSDRPDAWSSLFFSMDPISPARIWVEYYIYFPSGAVPSLGPAFYHRSQSSGGDQHKYFRIYADPYIGGPAVGFDADNALEHGANEIAPVHMDHRENLWGGWKLGDHFVGLGGIGGTMPIGRIPRGEWVQFRFHFEEASDDSSEDGIIRMWVNGASVWSRTDVPLRAGDGKHYFDAGYIFNYSNAGFDEETWVFVDDVSFFDADPGWEG